MELSVKERNPFLNGFSISVLNVQRTNVYFKGSEGIATEMDEKVVGVSGFETEQEKPAKIYKSGLMVGESKGVEVLFKEFSPCTRDLFNYIVFHLPAEKDYINLKASSVTSVIGFTRQTMIRAIKELVSFSIITKKSQSEYWINPQILFRGNRIKYARESRPDAIKVVVVKKNSKYE